VRKRKAPTKENQEQKLKEANKQLRSQIRTLRKQLKQANNELADWRSYASDDVSNIELLVEEAASSINSALCEKCGSETVDIPAGVFIISKCSAPECSWRKKRTVDERE
jgi:ribosomal protein S20